MKLTKREVDRLTLPATGQKIYWDSALKGFGLRVTPSRMTYVGQGRVAGRTVRVTLGRHGTLTPDQARAEARKCLADMDRGLDRNRAEKAERIAGVTLEDAYSAYVSSKVLAAKTRRDYERALNVAFVSWKSLPFTKITGGMISRRFDETSAQSPAQANQMFRFLRALLGWAMWKYAKEDGTPILASNPCEVLTKLKRWNKVMPRIRHLEPGQLGGFIRAVAHEKDDSDPLTASKDLCALLLLTGLREQEGCGLLWQNVDLQARVITIRHTKNHRMHSLPIGSWLAARIAAAAPAYRRVTVRLPSRYRDWPPDVPPAPCAGDRQGRSRGFPPA